jgi:hypothetical protein
MFTLHLYDNSRQREPLTPAKSPCSAGNVPFTVFLDGPKGFSARISFMESNKKVLVSFVPKNSGPGTFLNANNFNKYVFFIWAPDETHAKYVKRRSHGDIIFMMAAVSWK